MKAILILTYAAMTFFWLVLSVLVWFDYVPNTLVISAALLNFSLTSLRWLAEELG